MALFLGIPLEIGSSQNWTYDSSLLGHSIGAHSVANDSVLPSLTTLVPRTNRFNGLNIDAKSPLAFPLLPELDLNMGVVADEADVMASVPTEDVKLDLGTAMIAVMGGEGAVEEAEVIFTPSDDEDQGLNTLTQDRECRSHMRRVPSSEPLASIAAFPLLDEDTKSAGSNNARDVTAFT